VTPPGVAESLIELYPRLLRSLEEGAGGPFGAALLLDGRTIGWGTNSVLRDFDVSRHAEVNALAAAGRSTGAVRLDGAILVSSHAPCLMCYHAAKWAMVREVHYLFDYAETEAIFGFRGDARMLADLGIGPDAVERDPAISLHRVSDPRVDELYRVELPRLWATRYRERCLRYDV
jgi:tRNA(Arg) A34 adenosine deaminase TadA